MFVAAGDINNDGVADVIDNCPMTPNPDQADFDQDTMGDLCDDDDDNDGLDDGMDVCPFTAVGAAIDADGRPLGDIDLDCDTDLVDFGLFQSGFTGPTP